MIFIPLIHRLFSWEWVLIAGFGFSFSFTVSLLLSFVLCWCYQTCAIDLLNMANCPEHSKVWIYFTTVNISGFGNLIPICPCLKYVNPPLVVSVQILWVLLVKCLWNMLMLLHGSRFNSKTCYHSVSADIPVSIETTFYQTNGLFKNYWHCLLDCLHKHSGANCPNGGCLFFPIQGTWCPHCCTMWDHRICSLSWDRTGAW